MNPTFSRRSFVSSTSFNDDVATPSSSTLPAVGKSIAPAKFSSVDFPHPLRPTSATNCPASTSSDTPSSARTGCPSVEYSLLTFCRERIGIEIKGAVTLRLRNSRSQGYRACSQYIRVTDSVRFWMRTVSTAPKLLRCQRLFDRRSHFRRIRRHLRLKPRHDLPVAPDQKLREVPLNISAGRRIRRLVGQILVQRCRVVALHRNFRHHRKRHVVFRRAERLDLCVRPRLLRAKIIRRDSDDHESLVLELLVRRFQRGVLRSESAAAGNVDEHHDLALV